MTERRVVFVASFVAYVALAAYLVLYRGILFGDALSRVGNAQYVVFSRDPHVAAVGFVWNPLPSLVLLPLLPVRWLWPAMTSYGFAGCLATAAFMAGAVGLVRGILADLGVARAPRLALTAAFALHPMIALYGSNGMSEAPLLFFSLLAARALMRWLGEGRTRELVVCGFALSLAYLTRYEAAASALAVVALVLVVSWARARNRATAVADAVVVGMPFAVTFALWAVVSKVVVGTWFATFTSDYGNSAQVAGAIRDIRASTGGDLAGQAHYLVRQTTGLEPLVAAVLVVALLVALFRRDLRALGALAALGAVGAFDAYAFLTGRSFGWLRFSISVVPLAVVLAGLVASRRPRWRVVRWVPAVSAVMSVALAVPAAAATMTDRRLAREEAHVARAGLFAGTVSDGDARYARTFRTDRVVAADLDRMPMGRGAVLTDAAFSFAILVSTRHPTRFVITPDKDFQRTLADPALFGVRYLLVPDPAAASYDAVNVAYPGLWDGRALGATQVREWRNVGAGPAWRLFALP